eukprot:6212071-Pleurochrysis_carterae.AAC.8
MYLLVRHLLLRRISAAHRPQRRARGSRDLQRACRGDARDAKSNSCTQARTHTHTNSCTHTHARARAHAHALTHSRSRIPTRALALKRKR